MGYKLGNSAGWWVVQELTMATSNLTPHCQHGNMITEGLHTNKAKALIAEVVLYLEGIPQVPADSTGFIQSCLTQE